MKTRLGIAACLSLALLAGCDADVPSSTQAKDSLRRILQAQSVGRAWDRGERALQNNDVAGLSSARNELRKLGANEEAERLVTTERRAIRSRAELLVIQAIILDSKAYRAAEKQKGQLRQEAATIYRQALQVDPEFSSTHPDLLNAIGYFLADRGTSKSDFILAEKLTRRALQGIKKKDANAIAPESDMMQLANTRDSLAWALFRQGRFAEALQEQEQAVKEAESVSRDEESLRELRSHLQQIKEAALMPR